MLLPDFEEGGMPVVASNLLSGLSKKYAVDIILIKSNRSIQFDTYNSKVIKLGEEHRFKVQKYFQKLFFAFKLRKLKKQNNYKAVISYGVLAGMLNIISQNTKTKSICTIHSIESVENKQLGLSGKLFDLSLKTFFKKAFKVIGISQGIKDDLNHEYGLNNVSTIYNPYRFDGKKLSIDNNVRNSNINLVAVSRLEKSKRIDNLIKQVQKVVSKGYKVDLWIAGDGEEAKALKELAVTLRIEKNIHFLGFIKNVHQLMSESDFLLLDSNSEGFSNVILESLIFGTPVISEDIYCGPREILFNLENVDYNVPLKDDIQVFNNGILCRNIYDGILYGVDHINDFNVSTELLEKKLNIDAISKQYIRIIDTPNYAQIE